MAPKLQGSYCNLSFLDELTQFKKSCLKNVETQVTTPGGQCIVETHSTDWEKVSKKCTNDGSALGFVGDYKPDLQVLPVRRGLYVSSQDVAASLDLLQQHGITHILNVASGIDNCFPGMFIYKTCRILDLPESPITLSFDECFKFIETGISEGAVLVHCNAGASRSVTIVVAYLIKTEGAKVEEVLQEMKSRRPCVQPNAGFMVQLREYEKNIFS